MPYEIQADESVPTAILRIMSEQIARARAHLTDQNEPIEERVHGARKRFKETRAVIRLARGPLGEQYALENVWFRDLGRSLSAARDADAVLEALRKLKVARWIKDRARRALQARREKMTFDYDERIAEALVRLDAAEARLGSWPPFEDSFETIAPGLQRTYRDGRRAMKAALDSRFPTDFHEWRKRAKDHWYHAQLLHQVWITAMKAYVGELDDLSHALGDHHDLVVLRRIVASAPSEFGRRRSAIALLDAIEERQLDLERKAERIGRRIYAEPPAHWLARMRNYWSSWRNG